jgi:death-on-curing protein
VTVYLSVEQVLAFHRLLVEQQPGGIAAVRDRGSLESALARPAMTFDGEDLYPDAPSKAAALMHLLVLNHPFVDGNKRIGVAAAELFLERNGCVIEASDRELEAVTVAAAEGTIGVEALAIWFSQRLRSTD